MIGLGSDKNGQSDTKNAIRDGGIHGLHCSHSLHWFYSSNWSTLLALLAICDTKLLEHLQCEKHQQMENLMQPNKKKGKPDASPEARRSFLFSMLTTSSTKTVNVVVEILLVIRVEGQLGWLGRNRLCTAGYGEVIFDFNFSFTYISCFFLTFKDSVFLNFRVEWQFGWLLGRNILCRGDL